MAEDCTPPPLVIATWTCGCCGVHEGLVLDADSRVVAVCLAPDEWMCQDHGEHPCPLDQDPWACSHALAVLAAVVAEVTQ
jgi:hypothetical protein